MSIFSPSSLRPFAPRRFAIADGGHVDARRDASGVVEAHGPLADRSSDSASGYHGGERTKKQDVSAWSGFGVDLRGMYTFAGRHETFAVSLAGGMHAW